LSFDERASLPVERFASRLLQFAFDYPRLTAHSPEKYQKESMIMFDCLLSTCLFSVLFAFSFI
jgi:hypothetical protein